MTEQPDTTHSLAPSPDADMGPLAAVLALEGMEINGRKKAKR